MVARRTLIGSIVCIICAHAFAPFPFGPRLQPSVRTAAIKSRRFNDDDSNALEALQSLVDFHEGTWTGRARSFAVTQDVAAGIVQRRISPPYQVSVRFGLNPDKRDYALTETFECDDIVFARSLLLTDSSMDVDSVDASYSLDATSPDIPTFITGTDKFKQFLIEHCVATSDSTRARCLAFYGLDRSLIRIVVLDEEKIAGSGAKGDESSHNGPSRDALEMRQQSTAESSSGTLVPHSVSLLELSSGVWLGDAIIRDIPVVPMSAEVDSGRGFDPATRTPALKDTRVKFGDWSVGVQKAAFRWMWNFADEIRLVYDMGKAMGAVMIESLSGDLPGSVCVNEGLSRKIPKDERMVYIDWSEDTVGFLLGYFSIQLPRYLEFDRSGRRRRPFYTEFGVYQEVAESERSDPDASPLPTLVCSKVSRTYNYKGKLKQGTSFYYKLKRFGADSGDA